MPRTDRTFSDEDVVRIINDHLTADERQLVFLALVLVPRQTLLEELLDSLTSFIPFVSTLLDIAETLSIFFNRADIQRAREASAFIVERRNAIRRALNEAIDF